MVAVAVAYRRWSFTRSSNCKALTGRALVFWIGGRTLTFDCIVLTTKTFVPDNKILIVNYLCFTK